MQGATLSSTDGAYFLMPQSTGEVALFNAAQYALYGPSPLATVWRSQTLSLNAPFSLILQEVWCDPSCATHACLDPSKIACCATNSTRPAPGLLMGQTLLAL